VGNVPVSPVGFVPRPRIASDIDAIRRGKPTAPGGAAVWALQGGPGLGKTTIAAHLARTYARQQSFPDGVIWLTLGPTPADVRDLAGGVIQAFDRTYQPREPQATVGRLKELLRRKRCLLVLDDVWDPAHARPLIPDGSGCRVLLTTRDAALARDLGAHIVAVGVLEPDEAFALLSQHPGETLGPSEEAAARQICVELGLHPLALHLAAMQVAAGIRWSQLRDELRDETQRLTVLDPISDDDWSLDERRTRSILASFELSVRRLAPEVRSAFGWLGVLQQVRLEPKFLEVLWSTDRRSAEQRLRHLAAKGFLTETESSDDAPRYDLHGLLHSFARQVLLRTLGVPLPDAHASLLEKYRPAGRDWSDVADDGYIYDHLGWHLRSAGRSDELFDLSSAQSADGTQHRWYAACERQGTSAAFLGTLRETRGIAGERYPPLHHPARVEIVFRCVLLASISNGLAAVIPTALIAAMAKAGQWSLHQALTRVRQRPDGDGRIRSLLALIEHFPRTIGDDVRLEVLDAISSMSDRIEQQQMIVGLIPHLEGRSAMLDRVVTLLRSGRVEPSWIRAVAVLRRLVPAEVVRTLVATPLADYDPSWAAWSAAVFAPLYGGTYEDAVEKAMQVGYPHQRALALMSVVAAYSRDADPVIAAAIQAFARADPRIDRVEIIDDIGPYAKRTDTLLAALWHAQQQLAGRDDDDGFKQLHQADAIAALSPYLAGHVSLVSEVLVAAWGFTDPVARATALAALSAVAGDIDRAAIAQDLQTLRYTVGASPVDTRPALARAAIAGLRPAFSDIAGDVVALADFLPPPEREDLVTDLHAAAASLPVRHRAGTLAALAVLSPGRRDMLFGEALAAIEAIPMSDRPAALLEVAGHVGTDATATRRMSAMLLDVPPSAIAMRAALPLLTSCSREGRTTMVRSLTTRALLDGVGSWSSSDLGVLVTLSAHDASALQQTTELVASVENLEKAAGLCEALARTLSGGEADAHVSVCWQRTGALPPLERLPIRTKLMPLMPPGERNHAFSEAWNDADAESDGIDRAYLRSQLLASAPPEEQADRIASLLPALGLSERDFHHEDYKASVLLAIARSAVPGSFVVAELEARARKMSDPHNRAGALLAVVPHLDGARRDAAFDAAVDAARQIERSHYRTRVYADFLLPASPPTRRPELALEALRAVIVSGERSAELARRLVNGILAGSDEYLSVIWRDLEEVLAEQGRATVLRFIATCGALLDRVLGTAGAAAITRAILDVGRWFPPNRRRDAQVAENLDDARTPDVQAVVGSASQEPAPLA
jgi:hypothetical protein